VKRIVIWGVFVFIIFMGALALFSAILTAPLVKTTTVTVGEAKETVYATGFVEPVEMREVRALRPGIVDAIYPASKDSEIPLTEGSVVSKGQTILKLRDRSREAIKSAAKAELKRVSEQLEEDSAYMQSFRSRIDEAIETATDQRSREQRLKSQFATGNISKDAYEAAKTKAIVAEERVVRLREDLRQAVADLLAKQASASSQYEVAKANEEDDTIRSPIDGRILVLPLSEGEFASTGRLLLKVGDTRSFHIEAEVSEDDISSISGGKKRKVEIRLAGADKKIDGFVHEILPEANRLTKSYTVRVRFAGVSEKGTSDDYSALSVGGQQLFSGMTAELAIVVKSRSNVLVIDRPALTKDNSVFVLRDGRVYEMKNIEVGLANFSKVEIVSGLSAGDTVVISGLRNLKDGQQVSEAD
jgi:RND family efflux transporter MFP subunit